MRCCKAFHCTVRNFITHIHSDECMLVPDLHVCLSELKCVCAYVCVCG